MAKLRKFFTISVMAITMLSMSVVVAPEVQASATAGDLIKTDAYSTVYYLGDDGRRYGFPNEATYFSWFEDFSGVMTVPQSELESYRVAGMITMRPGTKLVKIQSDPRVYAVEPGGALRWIDSEATALALYGANWNQIIVDVPDAFIGNYTVNGKAYGQSTDADITATALDGDTYPAGTVVQWEGSNDVYYIAEDGTAQKFANEAAMSANRFKMGDVITATSVAMPTTGAEITGVVADLIDPVKGSSASGTQPDVASGLSVALAAGTPVSTTIIAGQAIAELARINFTASADGDAKITSLKLRRIGVSADTTLADVYLYDATGINRLADSATVSSGYITWNAPAGVLTVPAGQTTTVVVKSNIAASTSGQTVGVAVNAASDVTTNAASVSGSFPVSGNLMSIADATLAGVNFYATTFPSSDGAPSPQDEFEIWRNAVSITNRAVDLKYITFRQLGSISKSDVANFKLYIDGVKVGETVAALDANGYVTFDLSASPKRLNTGTRTFKVLADIVGGSTRTFSLSLRQAGDVAVVDTEYGANVLVQADSSTFSARSSTDQTIAAGNLTITKKANSPSGNIINGASNVTLATFELKATGERIKVENLRVTYAASDANIRELRNGALFYNGAQVGSTADIKEDSYDTGYTQYSLGSSVIVEPGKPGTLEVRADVYDGEGTTNHVSANDTIQVAVAAGSSNAQRLTSLGYISVPGTAVSANSLTVAEGSLTLSKFTGYNNHTAVAPQAAYKIAEFRLKADTTEAVNLTSFNLDFNNSTGNVEVADDLNDVYVVYGDEETTVKSTVASTTNAYSINETLAAGETIAIAVYGNVQSSIGTDAVLITDLTVSGTTVSSATAANSSEVSGQSITWSTGSIASAATSEPLDKVEFDDQMVTVANYEFTATNDTYTIEQLAVKVSSTANATAVRGVYLYDGATLLNPGGTYISGTVATTTGLSLVIPSNTTKKVTVKFDLNEVGTGKGNSQSNVQATLEGFWARNSQGTVTKNYTDRAGKEVYVYGSYPVVSHNQLSSSDRKITNDAMQSIYQFTVSPSEGGSIALKQMKFAMSWNDEGPTLGDLELEYMMLYRGTTDITSLVTITDAAGNSAKAGSGLTEADSTLVIAFATEDVLSSAATYTIKAIPKNFDSGTTSSDYVSIYMNGDTSAHNGTKKYVDNYLGDGVWRLATDNSGTSSTAYNFIWSDRTAVGHSSTSGSSTADWANGYRLDYLPLTATVMDKNPS